MNKIAGELLGGVLLGFLAILSCFPSTSLAANQVIVWSDNHYGQTNVPFNATNVISLAAGDGHCLALRRDGTMVAWGENTYGQTNVPPDATNVVSIACGSTHSLALRSDGTISMWGQMGATGIAKPPSIATNVVALALGQDALHAMALRADGTIVDWGINYLTKIPAKAVDIVSVAAGSFHSLALRSDGQVVAWGQNYHGEINVPTSATNIVAIAAGTFVSAALRADGTVLVWGWISPPPPFSGFTNLIDVVIPFGELSGSSADLLALRRNGTLAQSGGPAGPATSRTNIAAIAACSWDALALVGGGSPSFSALPVNRTVPGGANAYLRMCAAGALPLGYQWTCNGTNLPSGTNTVLTLTNVQPSLAGSYYSLVASNALGMTTNGPIRLGVLPLEVFVQPSQLSTVVGATVMFTASVIGQSPFNYQWQFHETNLVAETNSTLAWTNAQLPDTGAYSVIVSNIFGVVTNGVSLAVTPTIITNPPQNQAVFPGGTASFSIGLQTVIPVSYQWQFNGTNLDGATNSSLTITNGAYNQGGVYSVIYNDAYETVTNSVVLAVAPVAAWGELGESSVPSGLTNVIACAVGQYHTLVLNASGTVTGWFEYNLINSAEAATAPPGLTNVISISAGSGVSLALKSDGTVVAWGRNIYGQTNVPDGLSNGVAIAAGNYHDLALKSDGTVIAWGNNTYGQTNVPAGLTNVVAIAAGEWNSMALKSDGTVAAWGAGETSGSDPNFGQSMVPASLTNVVQIATGGADDLALKSDGSIVGWGGNFYGEDNPPAGLSNFVAIAGGYTHSVALKADGTVTAWGYNYYGETNVPSGLQNVLAIYAEGFSSLALLGNGPPITQAPLSNMFFGTNGFSVSIPSRSGRVYRLEYVSSLSESNWNAFPLVAGNGGTLTLTDPTPPSKQRFYRVRYW